MVQGLELRVAREVVEGKLIGHRQAKHYGCNLRYYKQLGRLLYKFRALGFRV